jgi:A/G-specific adenine glycosylase
MRRTRVLQESLLQWFAHHRRDLPWRRTKNPYRILVSEVMLQQTQVPRVVPKYEAFLKRFPSISVLARAQQRSVLAAWSGLGYNRRARSLHQLTRTVMRVYRGRLPKTLHELRQLPGVGEYTAAAVACFAYGAPVALVDTNVRRVLGRIFHGARGPQKLSAEEVWELAASLVPVKNAVAWNSMLMDFGSATCTKRMPKCETCPVRPSCRAYPDVLNRQHAAITIRRPFVGSNRYWRGKIISCLRAQKAHCSPLVALRRFFQAQGLPQEKFTTVLTGLVKDNLARRRGAYVTL